MLADSQAGGEGDAGSVISGRPAPDLDAIAVDYHRAVGLSAAGKSRREVARGVAGAWRLNVTDIIRGAGTGGVGVIGRQTESVGPRGCAAHKIEHFGYAIEADPVPVFVVAIPFDAYLGFLQAAAGVARGAGDGTQRVESRKVGRQGYAGSRRRGIHRDPVRTGAGGAIRGQVIRAHGDEVLSPVDQAESSLGDACDVADIGEAEHSRAPRRGPNGVLVTRDVARRRGRPVGAERRG